MKFCSLVVKQEIFLTKFHCGSPLKVLSQDLWMTKKTTLARWAYFPKKKKKWYKLRFWSFQIDPKILENMNFCSLVVKEEIFLTKFHCVFPLKVPSQNLWMTKKQRWPGRHISHKIGINSIFGLFEMTKKSKKILFFGRQS